MSWLWDELRNQFEVDDGGLYDIRVDFAEPCCLISAFGVLLERGRPERRPNNGLGGPPRVA